MVSDSRGRVDIHIHVGADITRLVFPDVMRSKMIEGEAVFLWARFRQELYRKVGLHDQEVSPM